MNTMNTATQISVIRIKLPMVLFRAGLRAIRRQQHSRDDQSFQHGDCLQLQHASVTTRLRAISIAVLTASSRLSV